MAVARLRRDVLRDSYVGVSLLGSVLRDSHRIVGNATCPSGAGRWFSRVKAAWSHDRAPLDRHAACISTGKRCAASRIVRG